MKDLNNIIKKVEEKTGEKIISFSVQNKNILSNFLCKIGFHKFYKKSGKGHFYDGQCFNCGKFISKN